MTVSYVSSKLGLNLDFRKCGKLERESLGLWSASATDHLLFECPLFGKHDPTYSRLKFQAFFASHLLDRYARLVGATPSKSCHSLRKAISSILCTFLSSSIHIQAKGLLISTLTPKDSKIRLIRHIRMDASWKVRLLVLNFILKVVQGFADKKKGIVYLMLFISKISNSMITNRPFK